MPRGDKTGPNVMGPMIGRGAGYCAGYSIPGFANPIGGRGYYGRGFRGGGRGYRNMYYTSGLTGWERANMTANVFPYTFPVQYPQTKDQEVEILENQASSLQRIVTNIEKRIEELQKQRKEKSEMKD